MWGEASEWIAAQEPLLVGADNLAWDVPGVVDEGPGTTHPGHVHLLVRHGIHIVGSLNLERLAADGVRSPWVVIARSACPPSQPPGGR